MSVPVFPRYSFPEDERKYDWLPILLDAFNILDRAIAFEVENEKRKRQQELACNKGCSNCCLNPTVPFISIELTGISWYTSEKLTGAVRDTVKLQLQHHLESAQCPFLVEGVCSIYPVRPIACRQFHVFGAPCTKNEDPSVTRLKDVWSPGRDVAQKVAMKLLPFYGITSKKRQIQAFESGYISQQAKEMHTFDWNVVYRVMLHFDDKLID